MQKLVALLFVLALAGLSGCQQPYPVVKPKPPASPKEKKGPLGLSEDEIQALRSKKNVELTDDLKRRLLTSSNLKLTPEEMQVLKSTGKVVLCGKCGYLLKEKKFKEFENKGKVINVDKNTGFAHDSLRERVIKLEGTGN